MCFIKHHVSEDKSSIVELTGGVVTLRCVSANHEPAYHFDAKYVDGEGHEIANVQIATGHVYFLEMENSAYHCPYDLASNKVNAIYTVYKIRKYDSTGTEHSYFFSCGMGDNYRGICFLMDEKTMRVHGAVGDRKLTYMEISNFPTSYYNPCQKVTGSVFCVVYDTTSSKSSLWVNHRKIYDFVCCLHIKPSALNLFNRVVHFDNASGFNGYIKSVEMLIAKRLTALINTP